VNAEERTISVAKLRKAVELLDTATPAVHIWEDMRLSQELWTAAEQLEGKRPAYTLEDLLRYADQVIITLGDKE
jgi:hypothetical protein